ncbi:MAG: hypothetical protein J5I90_22180 [Caldilineales bacterium]|nr:hypothetical protein [Caldilineales bacterium]
MIQRIIFLALATLGMAAALTACGGDKYIAPTPAGQAFGQSTLVYLWSFP